MEALKKAEQAKQESAAAQQQGEAPPALEPEAPPPPETPDFPELSLDEGAADQAAPAEPPPETETAPPALELVLEPVPPAEPEPAPLPVKEEKTADAFPSPPPPPQPSPAGGEGAGPIPEPAPQAAPAAKPAEPPPSPPREPRPAAPVPPRPSAPQRPEAARRQARNVFSAKAGKPALSLSKPVLAAAGVGVALLAAGAGYYFYRQIGLAGLGVMPPNPQMNPPPQALQPGQPGPVAAVLPAPAVAETPPAAETAPAPPPAEPLPAKPAASPSQATDLAEAMPERGGIRIQRGTPAEQLNPHLTRGYQALQAGRLDEAREAYRKVLQSDRNNRDALLGLAAIREREGDGEGAARLYQRLLELDPNDGAAQAGLTGLGEGDPVRAESRLKSLLAQQPDSDPLHFALGNLYAGQQRWAEAQQAYFRAFQKRPGNPDYLYNLAVSLDHLGQIRLARDYYQRALAAADRPHNFSPDEVRGRIDALEKATP